MKVWPLMALEPPSTRPRGTGMGPSCSGVPMPVNDQLKGEPAARASRFTVPQPSLSISGRWLKSG